MNQPAHLDKEHEDWRAHTEAGRAKFVKVFHDQHVPRHNKLFYPNGQWSPHFMSVEAMARLRGDGVAA